MLSTKVAPVFAWQDQAQHMNFGQALGIVLEILRRGSSGSPWLLGEKNVVSIEAAASKKSSAFFNFLAIAIQNTAWVLVLCIPLVVQDYAEHMPELLHGQAGWAALVAMLVTGTSLAQSLMLSWHIISGVMVTLLNDILMQFVYCRPSEDGSDFECTTPGGATFTVIFGFFMYTFLIFMLPLGPRGQLLALHLNTGYAYSYARGHVNRSKISFGKHVEILVSGSSWGLLIAVIGILFPRPYILRQQVCSGMLGSCAQLSTVFVYAQDVFVNGADPSSVKQCSATLRSLSKSLSLLGPQLGLAWWEGLDFGYLGRSRHLMSIAKTLISSVEDLLRRFMLVVDLPSSGSQQPQTRGSKRLPNSGALINDSQELVDSLIQLLCCLVQFSINGSLSDVEKTELKQAQQSLQDACAKVLETAQSYREGEAHLSQDEQLYLWSISQSAALCINVASDFMQKDAAQSFDVLHVCPVSPPKLCCSGKWIRGNQTNLKIAFWNTVAIGIGFLLDGLYLHGRALKQQEDLTLVVVETEGAGAAQNLGWLHSKHIGMSMRKILHRLCGIVIPFTLGTIVEDSYGDCSPGHLVRRFVAFAVIDVFSKYNSFASTEYGYMTLLIAAFLPLTFLKPCVEELTPTFVLSLENATHLKLVDIVEACVILTFLSVALSLLDRVDGSWDLGTSSASQDFIAKIDSTISGRLVAAARGLFGDDEPTSAMSALKPMTSDIAALSLFSKMATEEPRFGGVAWPETLAATTAQTIDEIGLLMLPLARMHEAGVRLSLHAPGTTLLQALVDFQELCYAVFEKYNVVESHTKSEDDILKLVNKVHLAAASLVEQEDADIQSIPKSLLEVNSNADSTLCAGLHRESYACTRVTQHVVIHIASLLQKQVKAFIVH